MRGCVRASALAIAMAFLAINSAAGADASVPGAWHSVGWPLTASWIGPTDIGGRVTALVIRPGRPATEIAGTLGGIWERTGGGSWKDVTSSSWPSTAIDSIAADPVRPAVLYAGTGYELSGEPVQPGAGVVKSTNGGKTWAALRGSQSLMRGYGVTGLVVDPKNDRVVVAANSNGLFRSADGGSSWRQVLSFPGQAIPDVRLAVDRVTGQMLVGVANGAGIRAHRGSATVRTGHAVYDSTDGGKTWTAYAVDSSTASGQVLVTGIASTPGPHSKTYAYALNITGNKSTDGLYTSPDGRRWEKMTAHNVEEDSSIAQLLVNPQNPRVAYFASLDGPYQYGFGNSTSTAVPVHTGACYWPDFHALAYGPSISDPSHPALYSGNDGGACFEDLTTHVMTEDNQGLVSGLDYGLSALSSSLELTGRQDLGVDLYTGGPGSTELEGGDAWSVLVDRSKPSTFYAWTNAGFGVSTDSGAHWHNLPFSPSAGSTFSATLRLIQATGDSNLLILPDGSGQLYLSTDDGQTWHARDVPVAGDQLTSIAAAKFPRRAQPVIFAGSESGSIWRSTDLGVKWTRLAKVFALQVDDIALDPLRSGPSSERLYVGLGAHTAAWYATTPRVGDVWESANGGGSWTEIGKALKRESVNALLPSGSTLLAGTDFGVRKYHAGSWSSAGQGFPNVRVTGLTLSADGKTFFASTYGRGTWEATATASAP